MMLSVNKGEIIAGLFKSRFPSKYGPQAGRKEVMSSPEFYEQTFNIRQAA